MPNNYFRFKQFNINQENCAMKVCTDACLFGAWVVKIINAKTEKILDIGTGTGLLSLMLAQKNSSAIIDAVEIDENAAMQATANFEVSPWKERLHCFNNSVQSFYETNNKQYDFIICNPPFFENDLKSTNAKRNLALHNDALSLEELLTSIDLFLKKSGSFAVLLPYHRTKYFETLAASHNFYCTEKVLVKQTPQHNYFRSMLYFKRDKTITEESIITIKDENNEYGKVFIELLKDYYLYL